jgi:hypothetical protein
MVKEGLSVRHIQVSWLCIECNIVRYRGVCSRHVLLSDDGDVSVTAGNISII